MHPQRKRVIAGGNSAPRRSRDAASRLSQPPLELVRSTGDRGYPTRPAGTAVNVGYPITEGQLAVWWEPWHDASILWLTGTLDRATASLLDRELDARELRPRHLVVDLTGLDFVDSPGLASLRRIHRRASVRGVRLSFRHGPHVVERPLDLARAIRLRSRWAPHPVAVGAGDEDFYFALAMACADVDHRAPGDRPGAA